MAVIVCVVMIVMMVIVAVVMMIVTVPVRPRTTRGRRTIDGRTRRRRRLSPSAQRHNRPTIRAAAQAAP